MTVDYSLSKVGDVVRLVSRFEASHFENNLITGHDVVNSPKSGSSVDPKTSYPCTSTPPKVSRAMRSESELTRSSIRVASDLPPYQHSLVLATFTLLWVGVARG